jgi:hypothetical protein
MGLSLLYTRLDDANENGANENGANENGADFYRRRSQEDRTFVRWMFEAVNLMDGKRTLGEIHDLLVAELGDAKLEDLHRLADDLAAAGMAALEPLSHGA